MKEALTPWISISLQRQDATDCFLISITHAPTCMTVYGVAPGNITRSPKQIETAKSSTPFPMHGLHQIPFATGMGEMALFQANATSNKPEAKWFQ